MVKLLLIFITAIVITGCTRPQWCIPGVRTNITDSKTTKSLAGVTIRVEPLNAFFWEKRNLGQSDAAGGIQVPGKKCSFLDLPGVDFTSSSGEIVFIKSGYQSRRQEYQLGRSECCGEEPTIQMPVELKPIELK